jgi:hypothetical protein
MKHISPSNGTMCPLLGSMDRIELCESRLLSPLSLGIGVFMVAGSERKGANVFMGGESVVWNLLKVIQREGV